MFTYNSQPIALGCCRSTAFLVLTTTGILQARIVSLDSLRVFPLTHDIE